jgi:hypothetical protein
MNSLVLGTSMVMLPLWATVNWFSSILNDNPSKHLQFTGFLLMFPIFSIPRKWRIVPAVIAALPYLAFACRFFK